MDQQQERKQTMWSLSSSALRAPVGQSRFQLRLPVLIWLGGLLLSVTLNLGAAASPPPPDEEAGAVLQSYFAALQTGDVTALGRSLGGELRTSRSGLFRNRDYRHELLRGYGGAEFDIVDLQVLDSGDVVATVDTWLSPSERLRHRLTLRRASFSEDFRIVDSELIP